MKKKKIIVLGMLTIMATITFHFNQNNNKTNLSTLSLINIEMLAQAYELPEVSINCGAWDGGCWRHNFNFLWTPCEWTGYVYD